MKFVNMAVGILGACAIGIGGMLYVSGSQSFMQQAASLLSEKLSDTLGTKVELGKVSIHSLHGLTIDGLKVYDKEQNLVAEAKTAEVTYSLLAAWEKSPAEAIDEVRLREVAAQLEKREDGTWNYEDFVQENQQGSTFSGKVIVEDGTLAGRMDGHELVLTDVQASADFSAQPTTAIQAQFMSHEANVRLSGRIGDDEQSLNVEGSDFLLADYLPLVPEGTLPVGIMIEDGRVDRLNAAIERKGGELHAEGQVEFRDGKATAMDTAISDIAGFANFTESDVRLYARANAEEQQAAVHGKVRWDTGDPFLELVAESESFNPGAVLKSSPFQGAVAFKATIWGQASSPNVDGVFRASSGTVYGYGFQNAKATIRYEDDRIFFRDASAEAFGGTVAAEGEFYTKDYSYTAHATAENIDVSSLDEVLPGASGRISADVGIHGTGGDADALSVYGSASGQDLSYEGMDFSGMSASFYKNGAEIRLDYLSLAFANGGDLGIEGTLAGQDALDMKFYGRHLDLGMAKKFIAQADMDGYADVDGHAEGSLDNPQVKVDFAAMHGHLFQQPFDALSGSASGSLDGVGIDSFSMQHQGHQTWLLQGTVGFTGEKRVDLQADTMGARMEDIVALVAPDQPLTGNVDNIIRITGTLDDPQAVGYVHFYRGSYHGILLSGMDGDYTFDDGVLHVQDFHIYSPMVDVDLNGTLDKAGNLDMEAVAHDVQLNRVGSKLPYPVSGHGQFEGHIGGTLDRPDFHGELRSDELVFNGEAIHEVKGIVLYQDDVVRLNGLGFTQNDGNYAMDMLANLADQSLSGRLVVTNGDINAMAAMFNGTKDILTGRIDGTIDIRGTLDNPGGRMHATIASGAAKNYPISDVQLDVTLQDRVVRIEQLHGHQGEEGVFAAKGTADLQGPLDVHVSAKGIQAGMIAACAGLDMEVHGLVNAEVQVAGTADNPAADASVEMLQGSIGASSFDSLTGMLKLRDGIVDVSQFLVQKTIQEKNYKASAYGAVPLRALASSPDERPGSREQFDLRVSLDNADLTILPAISPQVEWAMGATQGNVRITGTLAQPLVNGELSLPNGAVKLKPLKDPVTDMKTTVRFTGSHIAVEECSGKLGEGNYSLTGALDFSGDGLSGFNFDLNADRLGINCDFYQGPLSGHFHLGEGEIFGHALPKVSGTLLVEQATISVPSLPDSDGELPDILLDVGLELGQKVHFYSPSLYDMWIAGSAHYGGTTRHPQPSGTIYIQKGTLTFNQTRFTIREGEAYFNQVGSFLPSVNFFADAKMSQTKIFLALKGPVNQMDIRLTSSPEMSETEILKLLAFRTTGTRGDTDIDAASLLAFGLQMGVLGDVENALRDTLHLDMLTIGNESVSYGGTKKDYSGFDQEVYNVEIGKYISDKVMVRYKQRFGGSSDYEYGLQYDFNEHMSVVVNRDQDDDYIFGLQAQFKF